MSKLMRVSVHSLENVCTHNRRHFGAWALWQQCNFAESMPNWLICDFVSASVGDNWMTLWSVDRKHCHIGWCGIGGPQSPWTSASMIFSCVIPLIFRMDSQVSRHVCGRACLQHGRSVKRQIERSVMCQLMDRHLHCSELLIGVRSVIWLTHFNTFRFVLLSLQACSMWARCSSVTDRSLLKMVRHAWKRESLEWNVMVVGIICQKWLVFEGFFWNGSTYLKALRGPCIATAVIAHLLSFQARKQILFVTSSTSSQNFLLIVRNNARMLAFWCYGQRTTHSTRPRCTASDC